MLPPSSVSKMTKLHSVTYQKIVLFMVILCFRWQLQFLKSEFRGQLPQPYSSLPNAPSIIPPYMNNENREETSRYVSLMCIVTAADHQGYLLFVLATIEAKPFP
jgi:hypothetical protein